jgi:RND family efflux transporter MFP subunit
MKSGRHRVGSGRNGSQPAYQSVDVDAMLFLSSEASHQANGSNVHTGGPAAYPEQSHPRFDDAPGAVTTNGEGGPHGDGGRSGPRRWRRLEQRAVVLVRGRRRMTERQARIVLAALVVVLVVAVTGGAVVARSVLSGSPKVILTTAGPSKIINQPGGVGSLTEAPNNSFTVSLNLAGVQDAIFSVSQVDVVNGADVSTGTPLLRIDPTLLAQHAAQFQSQLASALQSLAAAEQAPPSKTTLGTATRAQETAALSEQVTYAQNLVAIAQGATSVISAPTNGYVTGLTLQPGQVIGAGQQILQIVNPSLLDVSANLLLSDIQTVVPGDSAVVVPTGIPGVQLPGTVVAVSAVSSSGGLEGSVIIQCQNAAKNPVPVGAQVFVHIDAIHSAAVSVPAVAVMNSDLAPAVFVLRHGRVYFQKVTVGATDARRDEILTGLRAGDVVVESNMQSLTDGERVRVAGTG